MNKLILCFFVAILTITSGYAQNQTVNGILTVNTPGNIAFELLGGPNGGSVAPVPTFYPTGDNELLAVDFVPHGTPTDLGYGAAWNDICTTDQIQFGSSDPSTCLHFSAGTNPSRLDIASVEYVGGTVLPLYFGTMNGDTPQYTDTFVINPDSTYQELNGVALQTRTATAAGEVTVAISDHVIFVDKASGSATTVNLPASPRTGMYIIIKDSKGDAATNHITVTPAEGTIDGAATVVIDANYGSWKGVYNGSSWSTL